VKKVLILSPSDALKLAGFNLKEFSEGTLAAGAAVELTIMPVRADQALVIDKITFYNTDPSIFEFTIEHIDLIKHTILLTEDIMT